MFVNMDPEEGGGTPQRRSRKQKNLAPLSIPPQSETMLRNNDNEDTSSVNVCNASLSQYNTAQSDSRVQSIANIALAQANNSSNTIVLSDPLYVVLVKIGQI